MGLLNKLFGGLKKKPVPVPTPTPTPPSPPPSPSPNPDPGLTVLLGLHNQARAAQKLSPLRESLFLAQAAQGHAGWMAQTQKMQHQPGANGSTSASRVSATGYRWSTCGENIAMGYASSESVFQGWMNSPGHRANILRDAFVEVGFGSARSTTGSLYWCAVFARPTVWGEGWMTAEPVVMISNSGDSFISGPLTG